MKKYRHISVLKNSYGSDGIGIGVAYQPETGIFKEMPKLDKVTDRDYLSIIDDGYFLK